MTKLFAAQALTAAGWARNVRLDIREGRIEHLTVDTRAEPGDERAGIVIPDSPMYTVTHFNVSWPAIRRIADLRAKTTSGRGEKECTRWPIG